MDKPIPEKNIPRKKNIETIPELTTENIKRVFDDNFKATDKLIDDDNYNLFLKNKELLNRDIISKKTDEYDTLYPSLDDPNFNIKISQRKEFNDNKYDGTIYDDIEEQANKLCDSDFELVPHQSFVRNFLSFQTPYNSLLLYHGLGTGKTCSAISVAEEMRTY